MSFTLGDVITSARDRHPAFHRTRVTDAVFARFLSDYQNTLIAKALQRESHYLEQTASIIIALDSTDSPGTVGAGTSGGLPASILPSGSVAVVEETAGALLQSETTTAEGASVWVAERVVTSATANTVSSTGAARTTNQDVGRLVEITAGKGEGQKRTVASNTAEQWTVTQNWATIPDTTSEMQVVSDVLEVDNDVLVVTALPALSQKTGYLVSLSAQGVPTIDYTKPLIADVDRGVTLPSMQAITGGTVRYTDGDTDPLTITTYRNRLDPPRFPAVWQSGETLYLCGNATDWEDIASLEVRYVPIAPKFTALTDLFLIPDAAKPCMVDQAASLAAGRVAGIEGIVIDPDKFEAKAAVAESNYLSSLRLSKRSRMSIIRAGVY